MKKKLSILLLSVFIVPLIALFGCGEVSSYSVSVESSSTIYGNTFVNGSSSGQETFNEGQSISLTANALNGSSFICWVYQKNTEISNNAPYIISNTTDENGKITSSVLTFNMSATTQGNYTAIFEDGKMMYTKLQSLRITSTPDVAGEEDDLSKEPLMSANITVSQGQSSAMLSTAYSAEGLEIKDNVLIHPENVTQVLNLSASANRIITASTQMTLGERTITINFRAEVGFQQNSPWTTANNYRYKVDYANETYTLTFAFQTDADTTYYLVLEYANLQASTPQTQII